MRDAAVTITLLLILVACGTATQPSDPASTPSTGIVGPTATAGPRLGAFPAPPTADVPSATGAALQAILDASIDRIDAPGMAAAVIAADLGTWVGAAGTSDGTTPLDPNAQFGIGSVTKTITAAGVLRLVEAGEVDLDAPISEYLGTDQLPTNGATVRQVLGMRSGVGDPDADRDACRDDLAASVSMEDLRGIPLGDPFFEPGARFRYTNANYLLAGILIEEVTGEPLGAVLRAGVLSDPGLERLIYQDAERPTPPLAGPFVVGYGSVPAPSDLLEIGGGYLPSRCLASSAGPAGGMASDAMTLARWGYLLYGGWVLGDDALVEMATFEDGYGLAAHDHRTSFGAPAIGHEGTVPGYTAQLLAFPDEGLAVAVLINMNGEERDLTSVARELRAVMLEAVP